jgi:hypothetical protein
MMTIRAVSDPSTPIGEILKTAGAEGVVLESEAHGRYALLPLDDELVDFLIERSPAFRDRCQEIRKRMDARQFQTHEEIRRQLVME